jgi:hypothetical protein
MANILDDSVLDHVACHHNSTTALARSLSGAMQSPAMHAAEQKPKRRSREEMPPLKNERLIKAYHRLRNSWQYEATGKVATAAVLSHLKAQRITHGGPEGIREQGMALIRWADADLALERDVGKSSAQCDTAGTCQAPAASSELLSIFLSHVSWLYSSACCSRCISNMPVQSTNTCTRYSIPNCRMSCFAACIHTARTHHPPSHCYTQQAAHLQQTHHTSTPLLPALSTTHHLPACCPQGALTGRHLLRV